MNDSIINERGPGVRVFASSSTWIEGEALRQLDATARLPGMTACVGLPDLHPGKGTPVGAAFLSDGVIYPHLVGNDIGCGMALWATDLPAHKAKATKVDGLAARLDGLDRPLDDSGAAQMARLAALGLDRDDFASAALSLGTPGRGNHFLELLRFHSIEDAAAVDAAGLDPRRLVILAHTGSRAVGEAILRRHTASHGAGGLPADGEEAGAYLAAHDQALAWAELNRQICAERMLAAIGGDGERVLDSCHNQVSRTANGWLHRKGAAPASGTLAVVPGSRGALGWLVAPLPGSAAALDSLAHGAGRKIARGEAKGKLEGRTRRRDLGETAFGGRVVCGEEALLWEEAPGCYKDAAQVVADMAAAGLCRVVATLAPLVTFKTSAGNTAGGGKYPPDDWRKERRAARTAKEGWR